MCTTSTSAPVLLAATVGPSSAVQGMPEQSFLRAPFPQGLHRATSAVTPSAAAAAAPAAEEEPDWERCSRTVYFARVPPTVPAEELEQLFGSCGPIAELSLFKPWPTSKNSKGCGLVEYQDVAGAQRAMAELPGTRHWATACSTLLVEPMMPGKLKRLPKPPTSSAAQPAATARGPNASAAQASSSSAAAAHAGLVTPAGFPAAAAQQQQQQRAKTQPRPYARTGPWPAQQVPLRAGPPAYAAAGGSSSFSPFALPVPHMPGSGGGGYAVIEQQLISMLQRSALGGSASMSQLHPEQLQRVQHSPGSSHSSLRAFSGSLGVAADPGQQYMVHPGPQAAAAAGLAGAAPGLPGLQQQQPGGMRVNMGQAAEAAAGSAVPFTGQAPVQSNLPAATAPLPQQVVYQVYSTLRPDLAVSAADDSAASYMSVSMSIGTPTAMCPQVHSGLLMLLPDNSNQALVPVGDAAATAAGGVGLGAPMGPAAQHLQQLQPLMGANSSMAAGGSPSVQPWFDGSTAPQQHQQQEPGCGASGGTSTNTSGGGSSTSNAGPALAGIAWDAQQQQQGGMLQPCGVGAAVAASPVAVPSLAGAMSPADSPGIPYVAGPGGGVAWQGVPSVGVAGPGLGSCGGAAAAPAGADAARSGAQGGVVAQERAQLLLLPHQAANVALHATGVASVSGADLQLSAFAEGQVALLLQGTAEQLAAAYNLVMLLLQ